MGKRPALVQAIGMIEKRSGNVRAKAQLDRDTYCRGPRRHPEAEADNDLRRARESHSPAEFRDTLESIMRKARDGGGGGVHHASTMINCVSSAPAAVAQGDDVHRADPI